MGLRHCAQGRSFVDPRIMLLRRADSGRSVRVCQPRWPQVPPEAGRADVWLVRAPRETRPYDASQWARQ